MSRTERFFLDAPPTDRQLFAAAFGLSLLLIFLYLIHADHGFGALVLVLLSDTRTFLEHPAPLVYVGSALAIGLGVSLAALGFPKRPIVLAGIGLLGIWFVGSFWWHLQDPAAAVPGTPETDQGESFVAILWESLREENWIMVTRTVELTLLATLTVLYARLRRHRPSEGDEEDDEGPKPWEIGT